MLYYYQEVIAMTTFGAWITKRRKELGLRPEHLAAEINVSVATIYNLESNKHAARANMIIPLARLLKVKPLYLLALATAKEGEGESDIEPPVLATAGREA
jgi:transcriptional regulator with XRE-family HTH domain